MIHRVAFYKAGEVSEDSKQVNTAAEWYECNGMNCVFIE